VCTGKNKPGSVGAVAGSVVGGLLGPSLLAEMFPYLGAACATLYPLEMISLVVGTLVTHFLSNSSQQ
jgi:predicted lipid-binding transport protein (Tim44 family)